MIVLEKSLKLRADDENEAQQIINEYKENQKKGYTLKKGTFELKTKKSGGEIIAKCYVVSIVMIENELWGDIDNG